MKTIDQLIHESCQHHGQKIAIRHKQDGDWQNTRYEQLWKQVEAFAAGLQDWGIRPGDRIALLGGNSPRWIACYLGILHSGGIVVPIDKELKSSEMRHVLDDCQARLLFVDPDCLETVANINEPLADLETVVILTDRPAKSEDALAALLAEWHRLGEVHAIPAEELQRLEALCRQLPLATSTTPFSGPVENLSQEMILRHYRLKGLNDFLSDLSPETSPHRADDTAVILYTSGTTGRSKGAMLSHRNIVSNIENAVPQMGADHTMHTLSFLPINHIFEQVGGTLAPLSLGGTVSIAESLKKIAQNLREEKPTYFMGVPAIYRLLLQRILKGIDEKPLARKLFSLPLTRKLIAAQVRKKFGASPIFISGGAALDPEIALGMQKLGFTLFQGYGITETSPIISVECPGASKPGSVGKPIPGVEVRIRQPNKEGVGEILVRGENVMKGYYRRPQATAEAIRDGWYYTGDLGRIDENGLLYICGRLKNLIVTASGKNVYPEEIENALQKSPLIAEVMVYGHPVAGNGEEVHAQIYPDFDALDRLAAAEAMAPLDEKMVEELIRKEVLRVGQQLADFKRVRRFTLRDEEFPKTTTRKIKRFMVTAEIKASD